MPKNLAKNHFETAGIYVEGQRTAFRFEKPVLSSFMSGMLVPLGDPIRVFPGTKLSLVIDAVIRSNTMVVPPLDGIYIDFASVWVPDRVVWTHQPQFLGENDTTAWTQSASYVYPYVEATKLGSFYALITTYSSGNPNILVDVVSSNFSLADKYGLLIPSGSSSLSGLALYGKHLNILAFRGYYASWNHFWRDENYQRPVLFSKGDTGDTGEFGYLVKDYKVFASGNLSSALGQGVGGSLTSNKAVLMPVNKFHDAFTSGLPEPQFGDSTLLPLGDSAPVIGAVSGHAIGSNGYQFGNMLGTGGTFLPFSNDKPLTLHNNKLSESNGSTQTAGDTITASNLVADLSSATAASINDLRASVMLQRYKEALARGGRRVVEIYSNIYQVRNSAAKHDYPELISRSRYMLGVNQVVATADSSGTGWSSHLGDTGAYSFTNLRNIPCCERDFDEFGYLHIFYCVRSGNRYSQSIPEHFFRETMLDEYNPFFDHIGDIGLKNYQVNNTVLAANAGNFSYQEAWWSERTQLAMATGCLNKAYGSLKYWILGETLTSSDYVCTPGFLCYDPAVLNDVFVSAYWAYPQFILDGLIHGKKVARMSLHSTPGIVGRI